MSTRPKGGEQPKPKPKGRRLWKWIAGGALALFVGFVVSLYLPERSFDEPVYQGKKLSEWLDDYTLWRGAGPSTSADKADAEVDLVVRKIGTNAIPTLLRLIHLTDSPVGKLKFWLHRNDYYKFKERPVPAWARNIQASRAFKALGSDAKDAVPQLIESYCNESLPYRESIAYALGGIGPPASNAVPWLLRNVTNTEPNYIADNSFIALGEIHAYPEQVVPLMITFLTNNDVNVRYGAISNLRQFGADAKSAVPALRERLQDEKDYVRTNAARSLKVIDPEAAAKAGIK